MRWLLPLGVVIALVVLLAAGLKLNPREVPSPLIGQAVPAFDLPRLKNPEQRVTEADLRGQVTLVNVWATWCPGCRAEHDVLVKLANKGWRFVGLNWKDDSAAAKQWLNKLGDPYVFVAVDQPGRVAIDWGVYGAPETFVIDKQGVIRHKHIGPLTMQAANEEIAPLLAILEAE